MMSLVCAMASSPRSEPSPWVNVWLSLVLVTVRRLGTVRSSRSSSCGRKVRHGHLRGRGGETVGLRDFLMGRLREGASGKKTTSTEGGLTLAKALGRWYTREDYKLFFPPPFSCPPAAARRGGRG